MTDAPTTGWPDPARPGVPLAPERDGWHWLTPNGTADAFPVEWRSAGECERGRWPGGWITGEDDYTPAKCAYLGPCLTSTEVAAQIEAARREGAEAMRESAIYAARLYGQGRQGVAASAAIQAAISALPLPGDDT